MSKNSVHVPPEQLTTAPSALHEIELAQRTVLVVDDDPLNCFLLTEALIPDGYRVEQALSGEEAVEFCRHASPDLVLLDIEMPGMGGLAACRSLRELPGGELTAIVMITGLEESGVIEEAFDAGATDFLAKPLNWRLVRQRVRFLLRHAAMTRALREKEQVLEQVQRMVGVGHWRWDLASRTATLSAMAEVLMQGHPLRNLRNVDGRLINAPVTDAIYNDLTEAIAGKATTFARDYEIRAADWPARRIAIHAQITYAASGEPQLILGATQDITALTEQQTRLRQADICIRNSTDGIALIGPDRDIAVANPAFEQITGYSLDELQGMTITELLRIRSPAGDLTDTIQAELVRHGAWRGEIEYLRPDGSSSYLQLSVSRIQQRKRERGGAVVIATDNSELRESERRLAHLAHHDPLTDLPNRLSLQERLQGALDASHVHSLTLLFIDLDGFKLVNDSLGHTTGDALLTEVARRLRVACPDDDLLARLGGDEFALLMFGPRTREQIIEQGHRLLAALQKPFHAHGRVIFISASIGVCRYPDDARNSEEMLRNADTAMYDAKRAGRGQLRFWSHDLTTDTAHRLAIESELREAITNEELFLQYQPKFDAVSGAMVGTEALVRWRSPTRGVVPPGEFITIAEESGLIIALSEWVIAEACRQLAAWQRTTGMTLPVAVNISPLHLRQYSLLDVVRDALHRHALDPRLLEIEITENSLAFGADGEAPVTTLNALDALGITIAIDDFGTGYSSLSQLKRLPIRTLKIDRSFITDLDASSSGQAIITAIVQLGKTLGMQIIAEGVETERQAQWLRALECDVLQGFLFSRPVDAEVVEELMAQVVAAFTPPLNASN